MKNYQDYDSVRDQGKAIPKPKVPTQRKPTKASMQKFQRATRSMLIRQTLGIDL